MRSLKSSVGRLPEMSAPFERCALCHVFSRRWREAFGGAVCETCLEGLDHGRKMDAGGDSLKVRGSAAP